MIIVAVFRIKVQNDFSLKILDICFHCLLVFSVACKNSTSVRFSFLLSKLLLLSGNFMIFLLSLMSYIYIIIPLGKGFKWSLSVLDGPFKSKVLALAPRNVFPSLYYFFSFCNSQLKPKNPPGRLPSLSLFWKFPWQAEAVSYAQHPFVIPCGHNQIVPLTFPLLIYFLSIHFSPGIPETMWKLGWLWSAYLLSMMCNQ